MEGSTGRRQGPGDARDRTGARVGVTAVRRASPARGPVRRRYSPGMDQLRFDGPIWYWKGPAPHHFVSVPEEDCDYIRAAAPLVTYGWGMIPARVTIGGTTWATALWPKDGGYIVPVRADVRRKEGLELGDVVAVALELMTMSPARERASR